MSDYLKHATGPATQREPAHPHQTPNAAGGYTFTVDDWSRLERFLILGSEGGTYYADERKLTRENARCVERCVAADGPRAVRVVSEVSDTGRAPKNGPAILALAIAMVQGDAGTRAAVGAALPKVCRTGTHLLNFVEFVKQLGGKWNKPMCRAVADWYRDMPLGKLALQLAKYQQRDGWSQRDVIRLSHPKPASADQAAVLRWATQGYDACAADSMVLPPLLEAFEEAKVTDRVERLCTLITQYDLPRECVPTKWLTKAKVWDALLQKMPLTAMIRNLATMTRVGLVAPMAASVATITSRLTDAEALKKARVHPITVLSALLTYKAGHGIRGTSTWTAVQQVVDALDAAFYLSFGAVPSTGKATLLAIDVSGSMDSGSCAGLPMLTPRVGAAAMALVTANVEPRHHLLGFSAAARGHGGRWGGGTPGLTDLAISPRMRLDQVVEAMRRVPMGGTDCSLPMRWAVSQIAHGVKVDSFAVYTDNETWAGDVHPHVALQQYRRAAGVPARSAVIAMTSTSDTIADPNDPGMVDLVGFDAAAPALLADFFSGGAKPSSPGEEDEPDAE